MALPGWNKDNIEIKQHKNKLTIEGTQKQELEANEKYVHKGLSGKTFFKSFHAWRLGRSKRRWIQKRNVSN